MLRASLDDLKRSPSERLHAACALAEFGEFDCAFPFASLKDTDPGEYPNVVRALADAPDAWFSALDDQIEAADANKDWPFKTRLAVVALHLGRRAPAEDMLEFEGRPDPVQRSVFIETLPKWHADPDQVKRHVMDAEHAGLRSGICLGVGSTEDLTPAVQAEWQSLLMEWYCNQPDGGTHSAAGWALRQWNVPIDDVRRSRQGDGWTVTEQIRLTMIRIPHGQFEREVRSEQDVPKQVVRITRDFMLSDREITIGLFREFVDDEEYQGEKPKWEGEFKLPGSILAHPVQQVNWYDAVMFCN